MIREDGIEVFHMSDKEIKSYGPDSCWYDEDGNPATAGWYWWECQPGCLPESEFANGPFATEDQAWEDAMSDDYEEETQDDGQDEEQNPIWDLS